jgi:hypothetical protein
VNSRAVASSLSRYRDAELGDFVACGEAVRQIGDHLENLVESCLRDEPRWDAAGATTDGVVIELMSETPTGIAFQGKLWLLNTRTSWALPLAGAFQLTADAADVAAVELMFGDAVLGLEPAEARPQPSDRDWMFRFAWP